MYFSQLCVCGGASVWSISAGCNSRLCLGSERLIWGPAALRAGGGALIIKVLSRGQEIVMPLGAQLRTGKPSLPPAFHWPMQVTWPNNSGARKETLGTGRRLHGHVTWVKGMDA